MNNVSLTGRITKEPELRFTQNGNACCMFTLAINRKYKDKNGETPVDFIPCVAWGNQATFINDYVVKGNLLEVAGNIQSRTYQTQSGDNRQVIEVIVDSVSNLTPRPKEEPTKNFEPNFKNQNEIYFNNDDLPF